MKQNYRVVVSLFLVLGLSLLMAQSSLGYAKPEGSFITDYPAVDSPKHEIWRSVLMESKLLDSFSEGLNQFIAIRGIVTITMQECGNANAYYQPGELLAKIVMCYELFDHFEQVFSPYYIDSNKKGQMIMGAWFFVLLHELGHALVGQLELPVTGKEEDAVDQLSTVLLTQAGPSGEIAALAGAQWFRLGSDRHMRPGEFWLNNLFGREHFNFADEHSVHEQRFYSVLCWLYGYNPQAFGFTVKDGTLPLQRAQRCGREYQQMVRTWEKLLAPHWKGKPPVFKSRYSLTPNEPLQ